MQWLEQVFLQEVIERQRLANYNVTIKFYSFTYLGGENVLHYYGAFITYRGRVCVCVCGRREGGDLLRCSQNL